MAMPPAPPTFDPENPTRSYDAIDQPPTASRTVRRQPPVRREPGRVRWPRRGRRAHSAVADDEFERRNREGQANAVRHARPPDRGARPTPHLRHVPGGAFCISRPARSRDGRIPRCSLIDKRWSGEWKQYQQDRDPSAADSARGSGGLERDSHHSARARRRLVPAADHAGAMSRGSSRIGYLPTTRHAGAESNPSSARRTVRCVWAFAAHRRDP